MTYTALSRTPDARPADLPDVRGWDVRTDAGERLGRVSDAILENGTRVRWLEVEAGGFFNPRRVLLPLEHALPDESHRVVRLRGIGRQQFKNLPEYDGRPENIGWLLENLIQRACAAPDELPAAHDEGADAPDERVVPVLRADERPSAREREAASDGTERRQAPRAARGTGARGDATRSAGRDAGAVAAAALGVRTTSGTERVRVPVTRYREEVTVERRAVSGVDAEHARPVVTDDEIRIPLIEEEIVIQRRAVVREEIVIRKTRVAETTDVEADVRKDRVEMGEEGRV